jgi:hypothetical protein
LSEIHFIPNDPVPVRRRGIRLTTLMVGVLVVGGGIGVLVRGVHQAREAARDAQCVSNLKQIGLALLNYREVYGCFPPAYIADADGKPMHSWRVLICPFMESSSFYNSYNLAQPWDSLSNRKVLGWYQPNFYECPTRGAKRGLTSYVMIVGPNTVAPGAHSIKLEDIRDGADRSICVAEVGDVDIPWGEPRDLDAGTMSWVINDSSRPSISSLHPRGPAVLLADGFVRRLGRTQPAATLKALTTISGGEAVDLDQLR